MKKAIIFFFLLIANIVLLGHSVIPHHHHTNEAVCFSTHCVNSEDQHNHPHESDACDSHKHEKNNTSGNCLLKDIFAQIVNNRTVIPHAANEQTLLFDLFLPAQYNQHLQIAELEGLPFGQKPHIVSFHSIFITRSLGLRAPPAFC